MKSLISVNYKFMEITPIELISLIKESEYCKGVEISIDINKENELEYLESLAYLCKENNLHFQVHGNSGLEINKQIEYLNKLMNISTQLGYPINVVMHSKYSNDKNESIEITEEYLNEVLENIDERINICVENLNDMYDKGKYEDRLNKNEITPIICNNERLNMTYDIGHDIADYNNPIEINHLLVPKIKNIHIHTHSKGVDHMPINKENFETVFKGILFLKSINYDGPVVFEYNMYECLGETTKEKIKSYLNSIDYVSSRLN